MADPARHDRPLTVEQYLAFDNASPLRNEYVDGEVYAMSGGTRRHNRVTGNIVAHLLAATRGGPCRVYVNDLKLRATARIYYYPDVMVACGAEPDDPHLEDAPCLVVEVLSPSTAGTDRREKLMVYRGVPSLGAYLIVDPERRLVERHWRDAEGWRRETVIDAGAIALPCPALKLTLDEIYQDIELLPLDEVLRVREAAEVYG